MNRKQLKPNHAENVNYEEEKSENGNLKKDTAKHDKYEKAKF